MRCYSQNEWIHVCIYLLLHNYVIIVVYLNLLSLSLSLFPCVSQINRHFDTGHEHKYVDKKQKAGSSVLPELIFVVLVVAGFWIANIGTAAKMRSHSSSDL